MVESMALTLRVDQPYSGESLTSFLGRAAQFYRTPYKSLISQLRDGKKLVGKGAHDLDLNPPPDLDLALARSVRDWKSPIECHTGFHGPVVMSRGRYAYCPRCFKEDIESGRTPYFRTDWAPLFVTTCWHHRSMLMPWCEVSRIGVRRLPTSWLYKDGGDDDVPAFFGEHLRQLDAFEGGVPRIYGGSDPRIVTSKLAGLQAAIEKQSAAVMPAFPVGRDPHMRLRRLAREVAKVAVGKLWGTGPDQQMQKNLRIEPLSYELERVPPSIERCVHPMSAVRRVADLNLRRTFAWVIAMSLEGTLEFGRVLCPAGQPKPWRDWWEETLIPAAGADHADRFQQAMHSLARRLDGLDWPGRGLPSVKVRRNRSSYFFGRTPGAPRKIAPWRRKRSQTATPPTDDPHH